VWRETLADRNVLLFTFLFLFLKIQLLALAHLSASLSTFSLSVCGDVICIKNTL
jgi:hypothetical protein